MAVWKQLLVAVILLAAAAFAWLRFFPGADAMLANAPEPEDEQFRVPRILEE